MLAPLWFVLIGLAGFAAYTAATVKFADYLDSVAVALLIGVALLLVGALGVWGVSLALEAL